MRRSWIIILLIALLASACTLSSSPASETLLTEAPTTVALDLPTRTPIPSGSTADDDSTAGSSGGSINTNNTNTTTNTNTSNNTTTNTGSNTQTIICNKQTSWQTYTVGAGDTLFGIAQRSNSTVDTLVSANCLVDAGLISVGQTLYVPNAVAPKPTNNTNTNTGNDNTNNNYGGISNDPNRYTTEVWWIVQGDGGNAGFPVGCGDSIILQQSGVPTNLGAEQKLVQVLLHLTDDNNRGVGYADRGFWNPMSETDLVVSDFSIAKSHATVYLTGNVPRNSACGDAQMEAQIAMNMMHLTGRQMATIYINGQNMRDYFGGSGASNQRTYNWGDYQNGNGALQGDLIEYWVSASSGAVSGLVVGCDNYMSAIEVDNFVSGDLRQDIEIALNSMFDPNRWIPPVFRNDLKNQNLSVQSVTINGSHVDVNIGGTIMGIGVCYDPVYEAQIVQTIFQFEQVQSVKVMNGERNLRQVSDQSGRPEVVDHVYTRSNFP